MADIPTDPQGMDENELSDLFEKHQQEFELEDMRLCAFEPIAYYDPATQKAWLIFKAGYRAQRDQHLN